MLDICCIKLDTDNMMNIRSKHFDLPRDPCTIIKRSAVLIVLSHSTPLCPSGYPSNIR